MDYIKIKGQKPAYKQAFPCPNCGAIFLEKDLLESHLKKEKELKKIFTALLKFADDYGAFEPWKKKSNCSNTIER